MFYQLWHHQATLYQAPVYQPLNYQALMYQHCQLQVPQVLRCQLPQHKLLFNQLLRHQLPHYKLLFQHLPHFQVYPKLSRLEEQNTLKEELSLVRQTKVICSLDLLLNVFKKCQHPGCTKEMSIKHHLSGPTLPVTKGYFHLQRTKMESTVTICKLLQV